MSVLGIGVDVVYFPRVAALISRRGQERLAKRILSSEELSDWRAKALEPARFLAVRFSAKEAAYKALYPEVRPSWKELTFRGFGELFPGSKPTLLYEPFVPSDGTKVGRMHVSISHDGDYIMSMVVAENATLH